MYVKVAISDDGGDGDGAGGWRVWHSLSTKKEIGFGERSMESR
jgi:hypothetical protein